MIALPTLIKRQTRRIYRPAFMLLIGAALSFAMACDEPESVDPVVDCSLDDSCVPVDTDQDGVEDASDNCPTQANADQINTDGRDDGGDACDSDDDEDGIPDSEDNCPLTPNPDQANSGGMADRGDACEEPASSQAFLEYIQADVIPGRFPPSECHGLDSHQRCIAQSGCSWMRTIKDNGTCRQDPVSRCLLSGECICRAQDFHGDPTHEADLEWFLPLSIINQNLAPRTSTSGGSTARYATRMDVETIQNESLGNFTSRTDFSRKSLTLRAMDASDLRRINEFSGMTLTLKLMHLWDMQPAQMEGTLFEGLGVKVTVRANRIALQVGDTIHDLEGADPTGNTVKDYQCNQFALVVPPSGDAKVWLGGVETPVPGLSMGVIRARMAEAREPLDVFRIGKLNAKIWDVRLYGQGRQLTADELAVIGKRCGSSGQYAIPDGYPQSNHRYSWGMGGTNINGNHTRQNFSSGVYTTLWIPLNEAFPSADPAVKDNLKRMVGFWDRWHEQMFFELDLIPFTDQRTLEPAGSLNSYRHYPESLCPRGGMCGELANYNNPCRYVTDLFQAFNWLPEDFPGEATSADHRRIAQEGGWTRWSSHDPDTYSRWSRPVHEHGHTAHFTLMRTYDKVSHYIRGIAGESFAEFMAGYVLSGLKSWMNSGLTYYPTIPLSFEGRWDGPQERHVFKSPQPYQERNIDDLGLGARFYGLGVWWSFVGHFAGKPYLIGRLSGDSDLTPGTTLQKMRFYLAQEGLDLGELFGNYAAHTATWDWPKVGHFYHDQEQQPFQGIEGWCTQNSGADCTVDRLKIQADVPADVGTQGEWVNGPEGLDPGGFGYSTVRMASAPGGALYEISLDFDPASRLYADSDYEIGLTSECRQDARFFSSRIVVADAGSEGQAQRTNRPDYYKIPGSFVDKFIVQVPAGRPSNIYLLAVPTPPFDLEDVEGFVDGHSLTWPFRYRIRRLTERPANAEIGEPIRLEDEQMLDLTPHPGNGLVYDCFAHQESIESASQARLAALSPEFLVGDYQRTPVENGYHEVTISWDRDTLTWTNRSEVSWSLEWADGRLTSGEDCPYGAQSIDIELTGEDTPAGTPEIRGLKFNGEHYYRQ
jgi:hypothetical protein